MLPINKTPAAHLQTVRGETHEFVNTVLTDQGVPSQKSIDAKNRGIALNNLAKPVNRSMLLNLQNKLTAGENIPRADLDDLFFASEVRTKKTLANLMETGDGKSGSTLFENRDLYDKEFENLRHGTKPYRTLKYFVQQALGCQYKPPTVNLDIPKDAEIRTRPGTFTPKDEAHGKLYDAAIKRIANHPEFVMTALKDGVTSFTLANLMKKNGGCTMSDLDEVLGVSKGKVRRLSDRLAPGQPVHPQGYKPRGRQPTDVPSTVDAIKILIWDSYERCKAKASNGPAAPLPGSSSAHRRDSQGETVGPDSPLSVSHTTPPPSSGGLESLAILHSPKASPPSKFLEGLELPPHLDPGQTTKRSGGTGDKPVSPEKKVKTTAEEIQEIEEWAASIT